jgi:hypothetical protein
MNPIKQSVLDSSFSRPHGKRRRSNNSALEHVGQGRQRLKLLIVKRHQVRPLHGTAPLDAVAVNRFDRDSLAARLAKHLGNAIAVSQ